MAKKCTVALVGGIVIVVSIAILVTETLTSPSRCVPRGETSQTETNVLQKSEPVSSPSTILSPRTNSPPHSTNHPSLGDTTAENSTPQPDTVLNTMEGVAEEVTSPSPAEEASDREPTDGQIVTVTLPTSNSTTVGEATRRIIIAPDRPCTNGEKRVLGGCRKKW
jgi:hypothetical protein